VAKWLEEELDLVINEYTKGLLSDFIEFLTFQKATLTKVSSPISKGLSEYRNAVGEKKVSSPISEGLSEYRNATGEQSVLYKRFRNLDKLLEADELRPLHDLMLLLFEALKAIVDERVIKFDSHGDNSGDGHVDYNINNGEYFVWVEYNHPETLMFSTFTRVTEEVIDNLKLGRIVFEYKRYRWRNDVDLPSNFINLNKQDQLDFLIEIVKSNLKFAESITHPQLKKS